MRMAEEKSLMKIHPTGEPDEDIVEGRAEPTSVDTFAGKVQVKWMPDSEVSSLGQMAFFIEFLKTSGLLENWIEDCPLKYTSPNAPQARDVLGTVLLSVLAGHWRYAHINAIRGDGVNAQLLGMRKVVSEDSVRRAMIAMNKAAAEQWLKKHLKASYAPLLEEPWALDIDTTVKVLYGHQEDAKVGYNPAKPGRPSHAYHSYFIGNLRIVLDVEVQAGNQTASSFGQQELWTFLEGLPPLNRPTFLRGDCGWGNERVLKGCQERQLGYVFKLKQSPNVKKLIGKLFAQDGWADAGQGWQGLVSKLRLEGWSLERRVVVLRRALKQEVAEKKSKRKSKQMTLDLGTEAHQGVEYEYAVLVTTMLDEVRTIAQHYRDRGDSENNFDELKNQWGWAGFTTHDAKRCQIMARINALVYNWWNIFMRLGIPEKHVEAITSRPLALQGIARLTRHANQTTVEITSTHSKAPLITEILNKVSAFLKCLKTSAEQLTQPDRWRLILSKAYQAFLQGKILGPPLTLAENTS